jgi:hypothetical protein
MIDGSYGEDFTTANGDVSFYNRRTRAVGDFCVSDHKITLYRHLELRLLYLYEPQADVRPSQFGPGYHARVCSRRTQQLFLRYPGVPRLRGKLPRPEPFLMLFRRTDFCVLPSRIHLGHLGVTT